MDNNTQNLAHEQNNIPLYITMGLLVVSLIFTAYTYFSKDMVQKGDLEEKYTKLDSIEFDMLPSYIQSEYINRYQYSNEISDLKDQLDRLNKQNLSQKECEHKIVEVEKIIEKIVEVKVPVEKIVEVEKIIEKIVEVKVPVEKIVEKIVEVKVPVEVEKEITVKTDCKQEIENAVGKLEQLVQVQDGMIKNVKKSTRKIDKTKFNTYKCYDMDGKGVYPSQQCIGKLKKYLDDNRDSKLFEVIGVGDKSGFNILSNLEKSANVDMLAIQRVSELAQIGLINRRVNEGIWSIKNYLGNNTNIRMVNYSITSQKKHKGFIVRAYK